MDFCVNRPNVSKSQNHQKNTLALTNSDPERQKAGSILDGLGFIVFLEKNLTLKSIFNSLLRNNFKGLT